MHPTTLHEVYGNVKKSDNFRQQRPSHFAQCTIQTGTQNQADHTFGSAFCLPLAGLSFFCRSLPTRITHETYSAHLQHKIPLAKTRPMRKQRGVSLADRASRVRLSTYTFTHTPGQLRELLAWTRTRAREAYASFPRMLYSRREIFRGRSLSKTDRDSSFAIS